jgi:hypothetical protein
VVIFPSFDGRGSGGSFHLLGCFVAERGMESLAVVVAFDVGGHVAPRFVAGCPMALMDEFDLERVKEALHGRVVMAVAAPAPRLPHLGGVEELAIVLGGILGRINWSSQHLDGGGCDEDSETALGSSRARRVAVAWPARGGAA